MLFDRYPGDDVLQAIATALTRAEQQQHLLDEIRNDAKLVTSGAELVAFIESS